MHAHDTPVSGHGSERHLLTREEAGAQSLEVIYRNHTAVKWRQWTSDKPPALRAGLIPQQHMSQLWCIPP